MFSGSLHDQTILQISKAAFLGMPIESFPIDCKAPGLSPHTLKFYQQFLKPFLNYCDANALKLVEDATPDFLRLYSLRF